MGEYFEQEVASQFDMDIRVRQNEDQLKDNFDSHFWGIWKQLQNGKKTREQGGFAQKMGFGQISEFKKNKKETVKQLIKDGTPPNYDHERAVYIGYKSDVDEATMLHKNARMGEILSGMTWATA